MSKSYLFALFILVLTFVFVGCNGGPAEQAAVEGAKTLTLFVGPEQVDCQGVAPQKCYLIKFDRNEEWTFLYDAIEGFTWEAGNEYELLVEKVDVENPLADAPSFRYQWVQTVAKTTVPQPTVAPQSLEGLDWVLQTLAGATIDLTMGMPALRLENGQLSASVGCNQLMGSYTLEGNGIKVGPIASTKMACDKKLMEQESLFIKALESAESYTIENGSLTINTAQGALQYNPLPTNLLPPTTGEESSVITGVAAVDSIEVALLESMPVQLNVTALGNYSDGCTTRGEVEQAIVGNTIEITLGTVRPKEMMCTEALVPFSEQISVDIAGLKAGSYTVTVNGVSGTFTLSADN